MYVTTTELPSPSVDFNAPPIPSSAADHGTARAASWCAAAVPLYLQCVGKLPALRGPAARSPCSYNKEYTSLVDFLDFSMSKPPGRT